MKVNVLKLTDRGYPGILKPIHHPPAQLFWAGLNPSEWLDKPKVAVVGSRKVTAYGREVTERLTSELAAAGVVIVSGLALGVDSVAHKAALGVGGITVAVLPTSLDKIYPASHLNLARQIGQQGTLISEYAPGSEAYKINFIARNRIVSGLADVLLITEAAVNSGTIHTAGFALEQGKTVMAIPGNINSPMSEGCNNLIKSGALPVTNASDVFFNLGISPSTPAERSVFKGSADDKKVLDKITAGISSQEELAASLDMDGALLNAVLTSLEISGYIKPAGAGHWLAV